MNKIVEHLGDKLSIYLLLMVIGSLMFYYYFTYVPENRNSLNRHASLILDDKAKSVVEKYKGYNQAINSAPRSYLAKWYFKVRPGESKFYVSDNKNGQFYFSENVRVGRPIVANDVDEKARVDSRLLPEIHGPEAPHGEDMSVWKVIGGDYYFVLTPAAEIYEVKKLLSRKRSRR